jgi:hypothetical protein
VVVVEGVRGICDSTVLVVLDGDMAYAGIGVIDAFEEADIGDVGD